MFAVVVQVTVHRELVTEFEAAILQNARRSQADEPGCLQFHVTQVINDPTRWILLEVYRTPEDWETHRASPHFAEYRKVAERAIVERTAIQCTVKETGMTQR